MDNKQTGLQIDSNMERLTKLASFQGLGRLVFLYKKTEKLVTALYMITNFIKDEEPLKSRVREQSMDLLSVTVSLSTASISHRVSLLKEYEVRVVEIVSLCGIARHSGFISEMNFSILKREFEVVLDMITAEGATLFGEEMTSLPKGFFEVPPVPMGVKEIPGKQTERTPHTSVRSSTIKTQTEREEGAHDSIKDKRTYSAVEEKKTGRRELILGLLKKKQGLNIKDFSSVIAGCSEKTIQRELLQLVADGTLKKEGERRWSRYFTV